MTLPVVAIKTSQNVAASLLNRLLNFGKVYANKFKVCPHKNKQDTEQGQ